MKCKVIQEFKGEINGIEVTTDTIYYTTEFIFLELEEVLGRELNERDIVLAFTTAFEKLFWKQELNIPEFEREVYSNIQDGYFVADDCPFYRGEYFQEANRLLTKYWEASKGGV